MNWLNYYSVRLRLTREEVLFVLTKILSPMDFCERLCRFIKKNKKMKNYIKTTIYILIFILFKQQACARIPFITFDPTPIAYQHVAAEIYTIFDQTRTAGMLHSPGVSGKWGALPNLGLQFSTSLITHIPIPSRPGRTTHTGLRDISVGAKYRFFDEGGFQAAFFPIVDLPTGNANLSLGNGKVWARLPFWFQKKWGAWKVDIGGGYAINSAPGKLNYFFGGGKVRYEFTEELTLGIELVYQNKDTLMAQELTLINAGGYYFLTKDLKIFFSAGHSIIGEKRLLSCFGVGWEW